MKTANELLIELDRHLKLVHLDMGGPRKNKYMVTHKTQPVLREIKEYVRQFSRPPGGRVERVRRSFELCVKCGNYNCACPA